MARLKQLAKWFGLSLAGLSLLLGLLAGLGYYYLQSDAGRDWAAREIERLASTPGEMEVEIGGLSGRIPFAVSVSDLRLSDGAGRWLAIDRIGYEIDPAALLDSTLSFRVLEAGTVTLDRLPDTAASDETEAGREAWPSLPLAIRLERLTVGEVALGPAVLGEPASFRVDGQATSQDGSAVDASLKLSRTDGSAGDAQADLRYVFDEAYLDVDAQVQEPAGGLIVRALGLEGLPALEARIAGKGPLSDWAGTLGLTLAGLARAEAEVRLGGAEATTFSAAGTIDTDARFEDLPWRLISGGLAFDARGVWRAPSTLTLDHGRLTSPAADLTLSGTVGLDEETLEVEAAAQVLDPHLLRPYVPTAETRDLSLTARIAGSFDEPAVDAKATAAEVVIDEMEARALTVQITSDGPLIGPHLALKMEVERLSAAGLAADRVSATADFAPGTKFDWARPEGRVTTAGTAGALDLAALGEWSQALGGRLAWDLAADVDPQAGTLHNAAVSLETDRGRLAGDGSFAWESGATDAHLDLDYGDLAPLGRILGIDLGGRLTAAADVTSPGPLGVLDAELTGRIADPVLPDPVAQSLAAPSLDFRTRVALDERGALSLTNLDLASKVATLAGDVRFGPEFSEMTATYRAELADLSVLAPAIGQPMTGSAVVTGRARGRFDDLGIDGDLEIPQGSLADVAVEAMTVAFKASGLPARPSGHLDAKLGSPLGKLEVATGFLVEPERLDLTALSLSAEDLEASGSAQVPLTGAPITLELDGRSENLTKWLASAGLDGGGEGSFRLGLTPDGPRQAGRLEAALKKVRLDLAPDEALTVEDLTATVTGSDLLGEASAELQVAASDLAVADLDMESLKVTASGDPTGGDVSATGTGTWYGAFSLEAAGNIAVDGERLQVELASLGGRAFEQDLKLQQTTRLVLDGKSMELTGLDLTYGQASLQARARRAPDQLSAEITVTDLPVQALRPLTDLSLAGGKGNARLRISGTVAAPRGELTLDVRQAKLADLDEIPPVDLEVQGDWQDGTLRSSGRLTGLTQEDVVVSLELPLRLDPETLTPTVPQDQPLSGALDWQGPVAPLWELVPAARHQLSGFGDVHVSLAGTPAAKKLGGDFALRDGRYESLEAGTLLTDLELTGDLAEDRIRLTRLSAKDGAAGSLESSGVIELGPDQGVSGELSAEFKDFALLRRDDITAVAKGDLKVTGSEDRSRLEGRIETESVEVHIPDRLPPDVVDLAVVEEGAPPQESTANGSGSAADGGYELALDLAIVIPRRAFIRGRGIDSEWAGNLKVTGTAAQPIVKGRLNLVRGQISGLGKTFQLDAGRVEFLGTKSIDPELNIVARRKTDDLEVTITASGRLSDPKLAFTSVPELPEDEIISQVLFGKSTSQLSAVEAAQLAVSVAELTGQGGGGAGILGRVRSTLGIDVLRLESGGDDSTTPNVAAGKYLTDDVYIGATQGADADSGTAEVEVEITPNISIESEVGQQGQSEVGVKFKWDY